MSGRNTERWVEVALYAYSAFLFASATLLVMVVAKMLECSDLGIGLAGGVSIWAVPRTLLWLVDRVGR